MPLACGHRARTGAARNGTARAELDTSVDLAAEFGVDEARLRRAVDRNWLGAGKAAGEIDELENLLKPEPIEPVTIAQALAELPAPARPERHRRRSGAFRPSATPSPKTGDKPAAHSLVAPRPQARSPASGARIVPVGGLLLRPLRGPPSLVFGLLRALERQGFGQRLGGAEASYVPQTVQPDPSRRLQLFDTTLSPDRGIDATSQRHRGSVAGGFAALPLRGTY